MRIHNEDHVVCGREREAWAHGQSKGRGEGGVQGEIG